MRHTVPRGFTLLETLIALAILAVISTLGYRAVSALVDSEAQLTSESLRWRTLDALFARLESDLRQALGRFDPVWEELAPREQARLVRLLVERVGYDGREGKVTVTFRSPGVKALCREAGQWVEVGR